MTIVVQQYQRKVQRPWTDQDVFGFSNNGDDTKEFLRAVCFESYESYELCVLSRMSFMSCVF